jgi:hypothetical protein
MTAGVRDGSDEQQTIHCHLGIKYHIMRAYESCMKLVINTSRTNLVRYFRPEHPSSYQSFGHFSRSAFVANCKGECLAQRQIAVPFDGEVLCESNRGYNRSKPTASHSDLDEGKAFVRSFGTGVNKLLSSSKQVIYPTLREWARTPAVPRDQQASEQVSSTRHDLITT